MAVLQLWQEYASGTIKGGSIREDLLDFIENVSPRDTPLYNNLGSHEVHARYVEYQEDTLPAAGENAYPEAADSTNPNLTVPSRRASIVQCFQRHIQVSGHQRAVLHAGLSDMLEYQQLKELRVLKTEMELALHRGTATTGITTAAKLRGVLNWGIDSAATANFTNLSGATISEKIFNDIVNMSYNNPVNLRELYLSMNMKRSLNRFNSSVQRYISAESKKQLEIIDVYESESGVLAAFKSRYQYNNLGATFPASSFVAIDPDFFSIGWLRPVFVQEFGKAGDYDRRALIGDATLICRTDKALAGAIQVAPFFG